MRTATLKRIGSASEQRFARFLEALGYESTNQVRSFLYPVLALANPDARPGSARQRRKSLRAEARIYRANFGAHIKDNIAPDYPDKFRDER